MSVGASLVCIVGVFSVVGILLAGNILNGVAEVVTNVMNGNYVGSEPVYILVGALGTLLLVDQVVNRK